MPELRLDNSLVDERYEVHERLGLGSYAEIWVARDHLASGREVVLKALNTSLQGTPDADLERTLVENFQNEAIALDTVRHPHVILRLGHGTAADLRGVPFHYLVLEYMPGGDLLRLCRRQPGNRLGLEQTLAYFKQACEALAYAHSQGIIHRDLKPNNLLLSADAQTLKIADFGVAKITTGEAEEITRVGAGIYAPPEHHPDHFQAAAGHNGRVERLTAAADIYSLAKSVYTVVCGRAPSQFVCQPVTALPLEMQGAAWAADLLNVLKRATAAVPAERYATVIEFWSDLANVAALADAVEEETQVRPRLNVSKFDVPTTPAQPDFNPVLASSGAQSASVAVAEALPAAAASLAQHASVPPVVATGEATPPRQICFAPKPKIVVDLPSVRNAAVTLANGRTAEATKPVPSPSTLSQKAEERRARRFVVKDQFTEGRRSWLFGGLLAVAFLGLLLTLYHQVRNNGLPVGFGKASRVEIATEKLNVRSGPGMQFAALGVVAQGTRHHVLDENEQGWMQIEVSQWDESEPHTNDQKQGWVYGTPRNAKVIGRHGW